MRVDDFDFELPPDRIAERPAVPRDAARLLVYRRNDGAIEHRTVRDLPELLSARDLLVVNDTKVLPHRLLGRRGGGGKVEALLVERTGTRAVGYLRPAKKVRLGEWLGFEDGALEVRAVEGRGAGMFALELRAPLGEGGCETAGAVDAAIDRAGRAPLPPYIARAGRVEDPLADRADYQTVFARAPGAIAAPTAGLHFTPELFDRLAARGVGRAAVTLHVGIGTFAPVRVERIEDHRMHSERFELPAATAQRIADAKAGGGRVIAVGTTSARTLESCVDDAGAVVAQAGESSLFLYPGCKVRAVDGLMTNFHLPQSTLLMLVAAMTGRDELLRVYAEAIKRKYRFYSFGDAMLVL